MRRRVRGAAGIRRRGSARVAGCVTGGPPRVRGVGAPRDRPGVGAAGRGWPCGRCAAVAAGPGGARAGRRAGAACAWIGPEGGRGVVIGAGELPAGARVLGGVRRSVSTDRPRPGAPDMRPLAWVVSRRGWSFAASGRTSAPSTGHSSLLGSTGCREYAGCRVGGERPRGRGRARAGRRRRASGSGRCGSWSAWGFTGSTIGFWRVLSRAGFGVYEGSLGPRRNRMCRGCNSRPTSVYVGEHRCGCEVVNSWIVEASCCHC
jgi:hypothetical protein